MAPALEKVEIKHTPKDFSENAWVVTDSVINTKWWHSFNDSKLNQLIDSVLVHNLDIRIAAERVHQFQAILDINASGQYPSVSLKGGYNKRDGKQPFGKVLHNVTDENGFLETKSEQYSLKTGLLLNLDVWGKFRAMSKSANASFKAAQYDLQSAYQSMIAQTVSLYYSIKALKMQKIALEKSVQSFKTSMDLQKKRYEKGTRPKLNLELSKQQYAQSLQQYEHISEALELTKYQLAVLGGVYPTHLLPSSEKPRLPENLNKIPMRLPSTVVQKRPDVLASYQRMEAARFGVGVARADRFPQLTLSADLGFVGLGLSDVFQSDLGLLDETYNVAVNQVLFAGGAKSGALDQKWAEYNISKLNYQKSVLNAFREVESALISIQSKAKQKEATKLLLEASENTLRIMKQRYRRGISSYEDLLTTERSYYNARIAYISAHKEYLLSRTNLYVSLGNTL